MTAHEVHVWQVAVQGHHNRGGCPPQSYLQSV